MALITIFDKDSVMILKSCYWTCLKQPPYQKLFFKRSTATTDCSGSDKSKDCSLDCIDQFYAPSHHTPLSTSTLEPILIDTLKVKKLSKKEKKQWRIQHLCLYCEDKDYDWRNYLVKLQDQSRTSFEEPRAFLSITIENSSRNRKAASHSRNCASNKYCHITRFYLILQTLSMF